MKVTKVVPSRRWFLLLSFLVALLTTGLLGQSQTVGKWSTASYTLPINPIHVALLNNGRILIVAGSGNCPPSQPGCPTGPPYGPNNGSGTLLLNPNSGSVTQFTMSWDMFCNGMVVLSDGRAFINGGSIQYDPFFGEPRSSFFDPTNNTFSDVPQDMAHGRWYPTLVTLGDGRVMTFSGMDETGSTNNAVEIYTVGSGWSPEYNASWTPPLYPRLHLLPDGKVFYSGSTNTSRLFDTSDYTWSTVATTIYGGTRTYGSSVLLPLTPANGYDPQVFIMGGGSPATATTELIDMGTSHPAWSQGPPMSQPRIEMNAVILPNGRVLALGGSQNDEDTSTLSLNADLYDPDTNTFSSAGANSFERLYHSVALLLPDATVWVAGGNPSRGDYESHVEIYQPAYLFQSSGSPATRPTITSAPSTISYGHQFTVQTPDASDISSAVLIRNGTVTHAFGMDQRMVEMSYSAGSGSLTITTPPNGNIAPPGYYMLFILNRAGVPSVAASVQLNSSSTPAPNVTSISPNSGTTSGGTGVTLGGTGFLAGAAVTIGGTAATGVTVINSTTITAMTPAHSAGAVSVVVTNLDTQSDTLTNGYTYVTPSPPPTVTGISPASGTTAGGTTVSITGSGFLAGAAVTMGGTTAGVTIVNSTTITATTPAHAAGAVNVVVTIGQQSVTLTNGFTYAKGNGPPTPTSIAPNTGTVNGGTVVTITGTGFLTGAQVRLGGAAATNVTVSSSTSIQASTPAHAAGAVNVVVTNNDNQNGTLADGYTYSSSSPNLNLVVASGDSSSATVTAGQTASYGLTIGGAGMGGSASLSCTGTPKAANCSVPSGQSFSANAPANFNVSVTTTARTEAALHLRSFLSAVWLWTFALVGIAVLPGVRSARRSLRRYLRLTPLALLLFLASCGGGAGGGGGQLPTPNSNGTPAGTYTLNVTATSGMASQTTTLTLIVK